MRVGSMISTFRLANKSNGTEPPFFQQTQAVIDRVQELATKDKMNSGLAFGDGMGKTTINDITTTDNTEYDDA